jgi:SNF2 family DNA or RNA helicase
MQDITNFHIFLQKANLDEKGYQVSGVRWCLNNEFNGYMIGSKLHRGGFLADEMGLGKTIQMLGVILCNLKRRTLIVMPRALLEQWEDVIYKMAGHRALVYHGEGKKVQLDELENAPVVLTTYGMVAKGKHTKKLGVLHKITWGRVIFDEAHHLRNKNTGNHKGALELQTDIRWMVTGTPIQNRKSDFYSLCAIVGLPAEYYTAPENLLPLVRCFMIKLKKEEVGLELPELIIKNVVVEWQDDQEKNIAEDIHSMLQFSRVHKANIDNVVAALGAPTLPLLVRARQVCVYPTLIQRQLDKLVERGILDDDEYIRSGLVGTSKIDKVCETINANKNNGHKKLVFCHYRGEIDILETKLGKLEMKVKTFDGRIRQSERTHVLNCECDVLLVQIQTGCEGLNLQHFSEIYFVSPHWNPAVEDQAVARCHRIGQTKEVTVYRFNMTCFDEEMETQTLDEYSSIVQEVKREIMNELEQ